MSLFIRALPARVLTLSRVAGLPLFLWLLAHATPGSRSAIALVATYLCLALSDYVDGPLARRAGTADRRWARIDVMADIVFNVSGLGAAAWLGLVGAWVPAIVALLGARFLWRTRRAAERPGGALPEDSAGKHAGVLFYLLVGIVVAERATGAIGPFTVARAADAVFLYAVYVLVRGAKTGVVSRPAQSIAS